MNQLLFIEDLNFQYNGNTIFSKFFWHTDGNISIIEGPSGCGKTTFLRILAGHLVPTSVGSWKIPRSNRIILQDDALFPWLTGLGNLKLINKWKGFDCVPQELKALGEYVKPFSCQLASRLSFGQRRLLELFRVLMYPAPVILLDEPFNFLDSKIRHIAIDAIKFIASTGVFFVIASHYEDDFNETNARRYLFLGDKPYCKMKNLN